MKTYISLLLTITTLFVIMEFYRNNFHLIGDINWNINIIDTNQKFKGQTTRSLRIHDSGEGQLNFRRQYGLNRNSSHVLNPCALISHTPADDIDCHELGEPHGVKVVTYNPKTEHIALGSSQPGSFRL